MGALTTCARYSVCFLAFITWVLGCGILGFMMWILATSPTVGKFFTGSLIFTYVVLSMGMLLFIGGLLGWIASYRKGGCLMKLYLLLSVLTIATEIGGILTLYIINVKLVKVLEAAWSEINQSSRNLIQREFECCGFFGVTDYTSDVDADPIDKSCYPLNPPDYNHDEGQAKPHEKGCRDNLMNWMSSNKRVWVACLGSVLAVQVTCVLLTVCVVSHTDRRRPSIDSFDTTNSHTYL